MWKVTMLARTTSLTRTTTRTTSLTRTTTTTTSLTRTTTRTTSLTRTTTRTTSLTRTTTEDHEHHEDEANEHEDEANEHEDEASEHEDVLLLASLTCSREPLGPASLRFADLVPDVVQVDLTVLTAAGQAAGRVAPDASFRF